MKIITFSLLFFSLAFNSVSFGQDETSELDDLYAELAAIDGGGLGIEERGWRGEEGGTPSILKPQS